MLKISPYCEQLKSNKLWCIVYQCADIFPFCDVFLVVVQHLGYLDVQTPLHLVKMTFFRKAKVTDFNLNSFSSVNCSFKLIMSVCVCHSALDVGYLKTHIAGSVSPKESTDVCRKELKRCACRLFVLKKASSRCVQTVVTLITSSLGLMVLVVVLVGGVRGSCARK